MTRSASPVSTFGTKRREVLEETGLTIESEALTGVYKGHHLRHRRPVFRCHMIGGHLITANETRAHHWATRDEISTLATEAFAVRLIDAPAYARTPAIRVHHGTDLL